MIGTVPFKHGKEASQVETVVIDAGQVSMQSFRPGRAATPPPIFFPKPQPLAARRISISANTTTPEAIQRTKSNASKEAKISAARKAQAQCLETCRRATKFGDRVSVKLLEHLTSVDQIPPSLNTLAHGFLDTCQVLLSVETGLEQSIEKAQILRPEVSAELEKQIRTSQGEIAQVETLLGKTLVSDRKGGVGKKSKWGWTKSLSDNDFGKMCATLQRTRLALQESTPVSGWNEKHGIIDRGRGKGYTGLAAALNRFSHRPKSRLDGSPKKPNVSKIATTESDALPAPEPQNISPTSSFSSGRLNSLRPEPLKPLPPLPLSKSPKSPKILTGRSDFSDARFSATTTSSYGSNDRSSRDHHRSLGSIVDETSSQRDSTDPEAILREITGLDISPSTATRVDVDPQAMPRWSPRHQHDTDDSCHQTSLISAIRERDYQMMERLLDRGVCPTAGTEAYPLQEALLMHDEESLRLLLTFGADPNEPDHNNITPLLVAIDDSFAAGAVMLLKYGADPNLPAGTELETPLAKAVAANITIFSHLFLIYGGDANYSSIDQVSLLVSAIHHKTPIKLVNLLLDYGAEINTKSREGLTPLLQAVQAARVDIVNTLLERGANANIRGPMNPLWPAIHYPQCLQVLLNHGADLKRAPGIVEIAVSTNSLEAVRMLLKAGADANAKRDGTYTALCTAIRDNRLDIAHLLLSNGADPDQKGPEYPIFKAVAHHRLHFLPALMVAGVDLHNPRSLLDTAVAYQNIDALRWLLEQGMNPNERGSKGSTPLTTAIRNSRLDMVDLLLTHGADPNFRGLEWPICLAVRQPEILERLLKGIVEPRAYRGIAEMAVVADQIESLKLLLNAGVSVEDRNGGVFSPLTTAIRESNIDIVRYLIGEGCAEVNAPGDHLPLVMAVNGYRGDIDADTQVIGMLLARGADVNKFYRGCNAAMQAVETADLAVLGMLDQLSPCGIDWSARDATGRTVRDLAIARGWEAEVEELTMLRMD